MSEIHIAGFAALLAGVTLDDGETPNNAVLPRTIMFPDPGASERDNLARRVTAKITTIQTTSVGETRQQAGAQADAVAAAVEDQRPVIAGWQTTPVELLFVNLPRRDDDVDPAVFYVVQTWRFTSVPVTA